MLHRTFSSNCGRAQYSLLYKIQKKNVKRLSEEDVKSKYLGDSPPLLSSAHSENNKENSTKQEESESSRIPLIEEKLNISKREVTYKEATPIKEPVTETKTVEVPVTHEEVIVERRPPSELLPLKTN